MKVLAPISVGELFDKISVLDIKLDELSHQLDKSGRNPHIDAIRNVQFERHELLELAEGLWGEVAEVWYSSLKKVNKLIWDDVDALHAAEKRWIKNPFHIAKLGRRIARLNDERAEIKRALNFMFKSEIVEEKLYN